MKTKKRSIVANLSSDDGFTFIYVLIPLTLEFIDALRAIALTLEKSVGVFSSVCMDSNIVNKLCKPFELFGSNFKDEVPDENECEVIEYEIADSGKNVSVFLEISQSEIAIRVIDSDKITYGERPSVLISLEEVMPHDPTVSA